MRILRQPTDFRVVEQFDDSMLTQGGDYLVYNVSKRGLSTSDVAQVLARAAGVEQEDVVAAAQKNRDGVAGQVFSVKGGEPISLREAELIVRRLGVSDRHVLATDITSNAFEIVVRDLGGDDMRRLRHNLAQLRETGMPTYFDDQRFGCLRHGQGYIVRELLRGRPEDALKAAIAAPSPYGNEEVEAYKENIRRHWGDWQRLAKFANGRRGTAAFRYLAENDGDFAEALRLGVSSRERTMHLYAYQSHLWNRALAKRITEMVGDDAENLGWLPCDEGSLPVWRKLNAEQIAQLKEERMWLPGPGMLEDAEAMRFYRSIFEAEGVTPEEFCALDLPGFRPIAEQRPVWVSPAFLRAAPAEEDDLYPRSHKMRVRFTLDRGQYAALILKRILMPLDQEEQRLLLWVSRHPLVWPDHEGNPRVFERKPRESFEDRRGGGRSRDDHGGRDGGRSYGGRSSYGRDRADRGDRGRGRGGDDRRSPWGGGGRDDNRRGGGRDDDRRGGGRDRDRGNDRGGAWKPRERREGDDRGARRERAAWSGGGDRRGSERDDNRRGSGRDGDRGRGGDRDRSRGDRGGRGDRGEGRSPWGNAPQKRGSDRREDRGGHRRDGDRDDRSRDHGGREDRGGGRGRSGGSSWDSRWRKDDGRGSDGRNDDRPKRGGASPWGKGQEREDRSEDRGGSEDRD